MVTSGEDWRFTELAQDRVPMLGVEPWGSAITTESEYMPNVQL
jgi:hypothetical protein